MPASIGVNLRVTGNCRQGGRKYMEDFFSVAYQQTEDEKDLEYAFFGIFDGHGGAEAAAFAKEHLMETIIKHKNFWSDNDEDVLRAIKDGYIATHYAMWREQPKWPKTSSGLPSTAGTTASVAFIRRGKIYIGHVGDSGIVLGYQEAGSSEWKAKALTQDHKPETPEENARILSCGGKVVAKTGVPRVVWNRPRIGHQGPVRRSTPIDAIPFLAVARSLGDLWSYNSQLNQFIVSPYPDCSVLPIDANVHRCLIFGTDGLYNMLSPAMAVHIVQQAERHNESAALGDSVNKVWLNPSKLLVQRALERWATTKLRADNTSVVTLMLDPPGPPRAQVLKDRKKNLPESGLKIMTRYDEAAKSVQTTETIQETVTDGNKLVVPIETSTKEQNTEEKIEENCDKTILDEPNSNISISSSDVTSNSPLKEPNFVPKLRESTSFDPRDPELVENIEKGTSEKKVEDNTIQINEISSSNIEESIVEEDKIANENNNTEVQSQKEKKALRRKMEAEENVPRKSLRLSLNQKFLEEMRKPAPCTLAEEKLKKIAEEAEKIKIQKEKENEEKTEKKSSKKMTITEKFLRGNRTNFKRKKAVKEALNKKKIKLALDAVLLKTTRRKNSIKPREENKETKKVGQKSETKATGGFSGKVKKFNKKMVPGKKNVSSAKALKFVIENNIKKPIDKKLQKVNDNVKQVQKELLIRCKRDMNLPKTKPQIKREMRSTAASEAPFRRSLRGADVKELNAKENITPKGAKVTSNKKILQEESSRKNTLRQRIQIKLKF